MRPAHAGRARNTSTATAGWLDPGALGALLRRLAADERVNDQIDWEYVAEEVESVGRNQLAAVRSLRMQALVHTLKEDA
jgi:Domain of unknown function DUF29